MFILYSSKFSIAWAAHIIVQFNNQILEESIGGSDKINTYNMISDRTQLKAANPICQQNILNLLYNISKHGAAPSSQISGKINLKTLIVFLQQNSDTFRDADLQVWVAQFNKEQSEQIKRLYAHKV